MTLIHGECLEELKKLPENSVDAIVTDPPYGLSFMGKKWDYDVPSVEIWQECLRVLKPGGYLLSFAGTRTYHRMATGIEDAGFEIRDMIAWVYGSGFPKSLNIGKAVDKLQGNEREELINERWAERYPNGPGGNKNPEKYGQLKRIVGNPLMTTKGTSEWEGWGTALKPALEPITVARKPIEGTVAENCLKFGVGGINIDECRVGTETMVNQPAGSAGDVMKTGLKHDAQPTISLGRFPSNFIHDGSDEVVELFPNDSQRFFYVAKASKSERNMGCEELEATRHADRKKEDGSGWDNPRNRTNTPKQNFHPTVKPIALMEYIVRLVSREGATVLDPFMGSGTTGIACKKLKRHFIGIEKEAEYIKIAESRISAQPITLL